MLNYQLTVIITSQTVQKLFFRIKTKNSKSFGKRIIMGNKPLRLIVQFGLLVCFYGYFKASKKCFPFLLALCLDLMVVNIAKNVKFPFFNKR